MGRVFEPAELMTETRHGYCECGCGQKTTPWPRSSAYRGRVKGEHPRFIRGHVHRIVGPLYLVDDETGCWLWQGAIGRNGYGHTSLSGRTAYAHRVFYEQANGPIPEGLEIDHVRERGCRHRHCVNPDHLEAVTKRENIRRGARTKLTAEQVEQIRASTKPQRAIAADFGIDPGYVCRLRKSGRAIDQTRPAS